MNGSKNTTTQLWKKYEHLAEGAGHGGMDFFVINAFVEIIRRQAPAPLDAYDAAAWSAVTLCPKLPLLPEGLPRNSLTLPMGSGWCVSLSLLLMIHTKLLNT
jgi:hypothetical protein